MTRFIFALLPLAVACQDAPAPAPPEPAAAPADEHAGHDHAGHGSRAEDGAAAVGADLGAHEPGPNCPHGEHLAMEHNHSFEDVEKWAGIFDSPERDAWQKPAELVAALGIQPGVTVADIGAGTGYFEPHLAAAVGAEGRVIALDPEPAMVAHMQARFEADPLPQVEVRQSEVVDTKLEAAEADLLLLVNTYHHITDRPAFFGALAATLKPGGRLAVVDYVPGSTPNGPPPAMRIAPDKVVEELAATGWVEQQRLDLLPEQYVLLLGVAPAVPAPAAE